MMDLNNKKLLILGGVALTKDLIKYAQEMGIEVYVTDYLEDSPGKKLADKSFMANAVDVEEVCHLIFKEKINGILTGFVDMLLPYYVKICMQTGLPCYGTKKQFETLINKNHFKELCRQFEIPVVEEYGLKDFTNPEEFKRLSYPVLLKPADNSGGRGITICRSADEFTEKYKTSLSFSKRGKVLIERFMQTKEVSIFYMLQNGEIKLTAMGDRHIRYFDENYIPLPVGYTFPSKYLTTFQKSLDNKVIKMFRHLGMRNGMVFIQAFVENENCIFYEMGYRLTGSLEQKIIEHASGFNPWKLMIEQALTGRSDIDLSKKANPNFTKTYCNHTVLIKPGKIGKIKGVEEIKNSENILDIVLSYQENDIIPQSALGTLAQVVARIFAFADSEIELTEVIQRIQDKFEVLSVNGESMLLQTFELEDL